MYEPSTGKPLQEGPIRYLVTVMQSAPEDLGIVSANVLNASSATVLQGDVSTEIK